MGRKIRLAAITLAVLGLLAGGFGAYESVGARSNAALSTTVQVVDLEDHGRVLVMNPQKRGASDLVRSVDGISMNIDTTDLPVGAYTLWWVVFNDPSKCSNGECGENDVLPPPGTVGVGVSPGWATGGIVGPDRKGHFSARLGLGLKGAPGEVLFGNGLTNPLGAEVHLILRYHGPVLWSDAKLFLEQQYIYTGFCTPKSSLGLGNNTAAFDCYEPQVAVHKAPLP